MDNIQVDPTKITPVKNFLFIEVYQPKKETTSGIILPDTSASGSATPTVGKIIKAGSDSKFQPGQIVLFRRYSLDELKYMEDMIEKKVYFLEDSEILGYIQE